MKQYPIFQEVTMQKRKTEENKVRHVWKAFHIPSDQFVHLGGIYSFPTRNKLYLELIERICAYNELIHAGTKFYEDDSISQNKPVSIHEFIIMKVPGEDRYGKLINDFN